MLRKNETIVIHPVFGRIRIEEKFAKVLQLKYFRDLAFKSQLGSKSLSPKMLNAKHTKLLHSIGVMHLTSKLLEVCQKKFSKHFEITEQEREILLLAALGHDLGHVAFSSSLEDRNIERTIEYFQKCKPKINNIFGYDIVSKVIWKYEEARAINIKNEKCISKLEVLSMDMNVFFIFKSLLIGYIDCDFIESIITDNLNVYGKLNYFEEIFEGMTISLLNDYPVVVFEKNVLPLLEKLVLEKLQHQKRDYDDSIIIEIALREYQEISGWKEEDLQDKTEYEILSELNDILSDPQNEGSRKYRLAEIIMQGKTENIFCKTFSNKESYEEFLVELKKVAKDMIKSTYQKIYIPMKDKIYIEEDGVIRDITEVSSVIRDDIVDFIGVIMCDMDYSNDLTRTQKSKIKNIFYPKRREKFKYYRLISLDEAEEEIKYIMKEKKEWKALNCNYYCKYKGVVKMHESIIEIVLSCRDKPNEERLYGYKQKMPYEVMLETTIVKGDMMSPWYLREWLRKRGFMQMDYFE